MRCPVWLSFNPVEIWLKSLLLPSARWSLRGCSSRLAFSGPPRAAWNNNQSRKLPNNTNASATGRLRIAIATGGRFHVLDLARELAALGHEVQLYSFVP